MHWPARWVWLGAAGLFCLGAGVLSLLPEKRRDDLDVLLILDITQSMQVVDMPGQSEDGVRIPVSRLAFARQAAREVIDSLPCGAGVGLGIFTEHRTLIEFVPVEVCANRGDILWSLDHIETRSAWSGNSEVSKALSSALKTVSSWSRVPTVVFLTDGHEAPPVNLKYRYRYSGTPGQVPALIGGIGGDEPRPIPRLDPLGQQDGYWSANQVMQRDPYSGSRSASRSDDRMVDGDSEPGQSADPRAMGTPGQEHRSALREPYLQLLAEETGGHYVRARTEGTVAHTLLQLQGVELPDAFRSPVRWLGLLALLCLLLAIPVRHRG